jgi:hypothetical protein
MKYYRAVGKPVAVEPWHTTAPAGKLSLEEIIKAERPRGDKFKLTLLSAPRPAEV